MFWLSRSCCSDLLPPLLKRLHLSSKNIRITRRLAALSILFPLPCFQPFFSVPAFPKLPPLASSHSISSPFPATLSKAPVICQVVCNSQNILSFLRNSAWPGATTRKDPSVILGDNLFTSSAFPPSLLTSALTVLDTSSSRWLISLLSLHHFSHLTSRCLHI